MGLIRIAFWFLVVAVLALFYQVTFAAEKREIEYTREFCQPKGWEVTHTIKKDGVKIAEVDCLGPEYAIEVERASNYYEAVGQSLRYAVLTGQLPGIVLIVDYKNPRDMEKLRRLKVIVRGAFLPIKIWVVEK